MDFKLQSDDIKHRVGEKKCAQSHLVSIGTGSSTPWLESRPTLSKK